MHIVVVIRMVSHDVFVNDDELGELVRCLEDSCFVFKRFDFEYLCILLGDNYIRRIRSTYQGVNNGVSGGAVVFNFLECFGSGGKFDSMYFIKSLIDVCERKGFVMVARRLECLSKIVVERLRVSQN